VKAGHITDWVSYEIFYPRTMFVIVYNPAGIPNTGKI